MTTLKTITPSERSKVLDLVSMLHSEYSLQEDKLATIAQSRADLEDNIKKQRLKLQLLSGRITSINDVLNILEKYNGSDTVVTLFRGILLFVREKVNVDYEKLENSRKANMRKLLELETKLEMSGAMDKLLNNVLEVTK